MKILGQICLAILEPLTSRKLWMTLLGLIVINSLFWACVYYLYSFTEPWQADIFYKMSNSAMWTTSAIVLGYLGLQTVAAGWTNATTSAATSMINKLTEKKEQKTETTDVKTEVASSTQKKTKETK